MPTNTQQGQYRPDSRGNLLECWDVTLNRSSPGHTLWLRGPSEVVRQIFSVAPYDCLPAEAVEGSGFTHALSAKEPFSPQTRKLLELLGRNLSLPNPPGVRTTIALDWYKVAVDDLPADRWTYTQVGDLVNKGKYSRLHAEHEVVTLVGRQLADLLFNVIRDHQLLNATELVLDIPGHDRKIVSFGSRLADGVAQRLGVDFVRVSTRNDHRPAIKNIPANERTEILRNEFFIHRRLDGRSVLIVDDMFQTGTSMGAVAEAATRAGARLIYGMTATRTLKRGL